MLGHFSLLPLLDGWNYSIVTIPATVLVKGPPQHLKTLTGRGWIESCAIICTDAYVILRMRLHGTRGKWWDLAYCPETAFTVGAFQQDPSGWLQLYNRPNPFSTAGLYVGIPFTGGYQGAPIPYVPEIILEGYLGDLSTESSALLTASADIIEITDEKAFTESYRTLMGLEISKPADKKLNDYLKRLKELQK